MFLKIAIAHFVSADRDPVWEQPGVEKKGKGRDVLSYRTANKFRLTFWSCIHKVF